MGIIKECGGKIQLGEKKWSAALEDLFECFKFYQESGNAKAKNILMYVILASMLSHSTINYADTREAKVYQDDPQIAALKNLRTAYEKNDFKWIN
jgi:COP9 signalosome complex subunit 2